jgi:hypothetical protein
MRGGGDGECNISAERIKYIWWMNEPLRKIHVLTGMGVSDPDGDAKLTADQVIAKHKCK